jgi:hypothetical protein
MKLLREITQPEVAEEETGAEEQVVDQAVLPEDGWNVGHLANHGILLSAEGFSLKLDLDQLNALFDLAEDGESGEVMDHKGQPVYVEVQDDKIILTRDNDETYPHGVIVDLDTLKEMGIEQHEDSQPVGDEEAPTEERPEDEEEPEEVDDTIDSDEEEEIQEGVKRAFRRQGKKIKRGFRVTSGFRKGRVVANIKNAFKPRKPARTRTKLKIAARRKKIVRILKSKRTRRKPVSKRLVKMNKRLSGK